MKYRLDLDYSIPLGDLAPYFDALARGEALASICNKCGVVAFPARAACADCPDAGIGWQRLEGTAQLMFRTQGQAGDFALVRFTGASTNSTVGLINPEQKSSVGKLVASPKDAPGLWLKLTNDNGGNDDEG